MLFLKCALSRRHEQTSKQDNIAVCQKCVCLVVQYGMVIDIEMT